MSTPREPQRGLGRAVRALRKEAKIDQAALAAQAGLPPIWVQQVESGSADPTWGDMRKVAEALDVSMERLSELAEELEEATHRRPS